MDISLSDLGWQSWSPPRNQFSLYGWDRCPVAQTAPLNSPNNHFLPKKLGSYLDTWAIYGNRIDETKLFRLAASLPSVDTIILDDGYRKYWGDDIDGSKFPHGLKFVVNHLKSLGYQTGIWYAPFLVDPRSQLVHDHFNWLILDNVGHPVNGFRALPGISNILSPKYILNFSLEPVRQHIYRTIKNLVDDGIAWLKLDFLYSLYFDPQLQNDSIPTSQLVDLFVHIKKSYPRVIIDACGCPFKPAQYLVDTIRISKDTNSPLLDRYLPAAAHFLNHRRRHLLHQKLKLAESQSIPGLAFNPDAAMNLHDLNLLKEYYYKNIVNTIGIGYIHK